MGAKRKNFLPRDVEVDSHVPPQFQARSSENNTNTTRKDMTYWLLAAGARRGDLRRAH